VKCFKNVCYGLNAELDGSCELCCAILSIVVISYNRWLCGMLGTTLYS
jgi:hypothetical protein